jgi:dihydroorotase
MVRMAHVELAAAAASNIFFGTNSFFHDATQRMSVCLVAFDGG